MNQNQTLSKFLRKWLIIQKASMTQNTDFIKIYTLYLKRFLYIFFIFLTLCSLLIFSFFLCRVIK